MANFKRTRLSDPAFRDLQSISEYTHSEWGVEQKKAYMALINKSFKTLSRVGNIGKLRAEIDKGLYSYTVKKHVVFFRETESEFVIIRILHTRMDMEKQLK